MVAGDIFLAPPKSFPATLVIIFELTSLKTATDFLISGNKITTDTQTTEAMQKEGTFSYC